MHGTANDFVVIDARAMQRDWVAMARAICDRHVGIGADGVLLVLDSNQADVRMRIYNSDGSEAETCGNGLRCFAKYAIEQGIVTGSSMTIETLAGVVKAEASIKDGEVNRVTVSMGMPRLRADEIPVKLPATDTETLDTPVVDFPFELKRRKLKLTFVSMGNPHAVTFVKVPVADFPLSRIGPAVENSHMFPKRTNFEVARVLGPSTIEVRTWERGVGETMACGSGACAVAVASQLRCTTGSEVAIKLLGGTLGITWRKGEEVFLSGPVKEVFRGELIE